jgi:hypothetical protein
MAEKHEMKETTRREIMKRALYVAPVIMTLTVSPSFASAASGSPGGVTGTMGMMGMM